ncbi:MAG: hypothetical protein II006_03430 [Peptostreptococcaceae bacterium]|nr:hypothetical protein [Peptostreptococcaceae bacterium]
MKIEQIRILLNQISKEYQFLEDSLIENSNTVEELNNKIRRVKEYLNSKTATDVLTCRRDIMEILKGEDNE